VIWVHDKHGKEVLKQFFELLSEEQRASIECVTADGARWIS
jgi:transposase